MVTAHRIHDFCKRILAKYHDTQLVILVVVILILILQFVEIAGGNLS